VCREILNGRCVGNSNISGLTLLKGYAFVQYETEAIAQAAVNGELGSSLKGRKLGRCK